MTDGSRQLGPEWHPDAGTTMARFTYWLAGQRVLSVDRYRIHEEIEHFLQWSDALNVSRADPRAAVRSYLTTMRRSGLAAGLLETMRTSLNAYLSYEGQPPLDRPMTTHPMTTHPMTTHPVGLPHGRGDQPNLRRGPV